MDSLPLADAIVVLGGDSSDFARARHGVRLFHQGHAPTVVLSLALSRSPERNEGAAEVIGFSKNDGSRYSSAQRSLEVAQRAGLPPDATIIAYGARSTYDEAVKLRQLAQQHNWHSLIIVTDLFHAHRAGRTFRALLPDVTICVSAAPNPKYDAGHWWQSKDSLMYVLSEALKLAYYWAKYGIAPVETWPRDRGR